MHPTYSLDQMRELAVAAPDHKFTQKVLGHRLTVSWNEGDDTFRIVVGNSLIFPRTARSFIAEEMERQL